MKNLLDCQYDKNGNYSLGKIVDIICQKIGKDIQMAVRKYWVSVNFIHDMGEPSASATEGQSWILKVASITHTPAKEPTLSQNYFRK